MDAIEKDLEILSTFVWILFQGGEGEVIVPLEDAEARFQFDGEVERIVRSNRK